MKEHGRVYQDQEEETNRLEIFQRNLNYIRDMNSNRKSPHSHRLGLNKFADLSPERFSKIYLQHPKEVSLLNSLPTNMELKKKYSSEHVPASWDWREKGVITEVKHQGQCGSGWVFSATGAIEAVNAIVTGNLVSLSEQELIDCVNKSQGCNKGRHFHSFEWVIENGGIAIEVDYPYTAKDGTCKANKGIYDGANCSSPYKINHYVLIVGYGSLDGIDYWIVKNSWGRNWGMDGYMWIKRNTGN
ncbi:Peptidase C1A, papain C-terminal [Sesbania bispinosa]|nr:Peptidase C1A, papain C-terminal [Sesbania bispinosa]